jgi:hypothetical protein
LHIIKTHGYGKREAVPMEMDPEASTPRIPISIPKLGILSLIRSFPRKATITQTGLE